MNTTTICISATKMQTRGLFFESNFLDDSFCLLLLQLFLASAVIILTIVLFKPFNQPAMVSQILGGILLGPSLLGRSEFFRETFFPSRSLILVNVIAKFGIIFYFFLIGVEMEPSIVRKSGKKEVAIGISVIMVPLIISFSFTMILKGFRSIDMSTVRSLAVTGTAESIIHFPTIARYLSDLKILNSELGRVALSSSMISSLFGFLIVIITVLSRERMPLSGSLVVDATMMVMFIFFIVRPTFLWMIRKNPKGQPLKQEFIYGIMLAVLVIGLLGWTIGTHIAFGPLVLGLAIPSGPPLGSALVEKLDLLNSWMFMPLYFVKNGLSMNIFAVHYKNFLLMLFNILVCFLGKLIGVMLPSLYFKTPLRDALSLSLVMNAQGVLEIGLFRMLKRHALINDDAYLAMCISVLLRIGAITPMIRHLYDPSRRYSVFKKRTILHSRPNSELRLLFCVHDQWNVPAIINLLEASNPTKESPIAVYLLYLMELVGRATPLLISHKLNRRFSSNATPSETIINAFRRYEQSKNNQGTVTVHPFSTISPFATMHDDICLMAFEKRTSLILVPFHKQYVNAADSNMFESSKTGFRIVNNNVLDKAPCSVGIVIDRGSRSLLTSWSSYHVAVLFLGGGDDREALALGARMSGHPNMNLTVIRLLENRNTSSDDTAETKLDNEVVSEFILGKSDNDRVMYVEEVVMDASETIAVIKSMENSYELILVGRRHVKPSSLFMGIAEWNEYNELGAFGDFMASRDFKGKTTILVLQQHDNVGAAGLHENAADNHSTQLEEPHPINVAREMLM